MWRPLIGSLCSGYGGLELAVAPIFGGRTAWHAEIDPDAGRVLAHRFPRVPNLGDIKKIDWDRAGQIDILEAGYPCQPFSEAGDRRGTDDERHLWPWIFEAIRRLRPGLVILENVPGHLSLGFGTVLGDLAGIGFDAEWIVLPASGVGAAHRRRRVFVLGWPADSEGQGRNGRGIPVYPPGKRRQPPHPSGQVAIDPGRKSLLPTPRATDGTKGGPNQRDSAGDLTPPSAVQPWNWGQYSAAIARHERLAGRPAPDPTEPGPNGPRLAPRFTEWLMCLPDGWVTDVPGLTRSAQLRILGNGVVPPQGEAAIRELVVRSDWEPTV